MGAAAAVAGLCFMNYTDNYSYYDDYYLFLLHRIACF